MTTVNKAATIAASPDRILRILLDVEDWPSWQPAIDKIEVLERDRQGRPKQTRIVAGGAEQETVCVQLYDYTEQYRFEYFMTEGIGIASNDGSYAIADRGDGSCDVTVNMRLEADWPLPADEIAALVDAGVQALVDGLKAKAEQPA
jgi:ribosome-associated toxin RatA of RatAB toxin-antitoxin module